ncbi:MAG: DUF2190 domain-containing protein [Burkholderiales bacterium RIFOXYD12_FULL_59_19]|nr:MAG: DUF2190 domain-containing protein [Burkholderiales bacterium RIFOXYD12_FULL_59_19]
MQTEKVLLTVSVLAVSALVVQRLVAFDGAMCAAGERAMGVPRQAGAVGDWVGVATHGELLVEAGAAVAVGDQVEADATACAITLAAGVPFGVARDAALAAGDIIRVLV